MNVRQMFLALIAVALGSTVYATEVGIGGTTASEVNLSVTHPNDVPVINTEVHTMRVTMLPMNAEMAAGEGTIIHQAWYEDDGVLRETFTAKVLAQIPSKVAGLDTLKSAMNADVRISLVTNGVQRAECMLAVQPITSRTYVEYALELRALWFEVRPSIGVCDIDMEQPGIQVGIPQMHARDLLTTFVKAQPDSRQAFLDGYCY